MENNTIIEKLICGYSLSTYMIPDDSIPSNRPLHSEGFYLPHILIKDNIFWGMSRDQHLTHNFGSDRIGSGMFAYTNGFNGIFFSYNPTAEVGLIFMPLNRYKRHKFILKNKFDLIWDSEQKEQYPLTKIDYAIKQGLLFKIAMLDSEDIWNIHPVDLPSYSINENRFNMKTELYRYPLTIRDYGVIQDWAEKNKVWISKKPKENIDGTMLIKSNLFICFYNLSDDGSYYNFYDIPRSTTQKYKRLRIFCEKE